MKLCMLGCLRGLPQILHAKGVSHGTTAELEKRIASPRLDFDEGDWQHIAEYDPRQRAVLTYVEARRSCTVRWGPAVSRGHTQPDQAALKTPPFANFYEKESMAPDTSRSRRTHKKLVHQGFAKAYSVGGILWCVTL